MKKFFSFMLSALIFMSSPLFAMESTKIIYLEHINSAEKLRELKSMYPVLEVQEKSKNDQGFKILPQEKDLTPTAASILQRYPVQGMWIITQNEDNVPNAIGRLTLSVHGEEVHITSWLDSRYRRRGFGEQAHRLIFEKITPYLEQEIKYLDMIIVHNPLRHAFQEESLKFSGIFLDILPGNYASLISYLRAGASIVGYQKAAVGWRGVNREFVSSVTLHYPVKEISQEQLNNDPILKILKEDVEPCIVDQSTRQVAIEQLKKMDKPF